MVRKGVPLFLLFQLFLTPFTGNAQSPSKGEELREKHPSASSVYLKRKKKLEIEEDGNGGLEVFSEAYKKVFYLDGTASAYTEKKIDHSGFFHLEDIEASSYVPKKGGGFDEIEVEEFKKKDVVMEGAFHNDHRRVSFSFPKLEKNGMSEIRYSFSIDEARFLLPFYFRTNRPDEKAVYQVTVDKGINMSFKFFNIDSSELEYSRDKNLFGTKITHRWELKDQEALPVSDKVRDKAYYAPHIVPIVRSYEKGDSLQPVLTDLDHLYAWYRDLVEEPLSQGAPKLEPVVDSLVKGVEKEEEKVKRIYYWVKDNIRYIAIENGLGGFVPRPASKVYQRGYGDCKDMSTLIKKMLEYAGIESHLTWVGTRSIPYEYEELPTPSVDNHMILTYIDPDGEPRFLDATNPDLEYPYPTPFIQGKKALVGKGKGAYEVMEIPKVPASTSKYEETMHLSLEDGVLTGSSEASLEGYLGMDARRFFLRDLQRSEKEKVSLYMQMGNNKFSVTDHEVKGVEDRDENVKIEMDYRIPDYITKSGDEIYLTLILNKVRVKKMKKEKDVGKGILFKNLQVQHIFLEIPEGYEVSHIPEKKEYIDDRFEISVSYEQISPDTVRADYRYAQRFLYLPPDHRKEWNEHIRVYKKARNNYLILKKSEQK